MNKPTLAAMSLLIGTIVGAGYLGIPYVVARSGFLLGLLHIAVVGFSVCILTLYLAEIALRTRGHHQLPGYARRYLGTPGTMLMRLAVIGGIYAALAAYLVAEGQSLSFLFAGSNDYALPALLLAWLLFTGIAHHKTAIGKTERIGVSLMLALMLLIIVLNVPAIKTENLATLSLANAFVPFGVILFAFLGFSIIPEMKQRLAGNPRSMKCAIVSSFALIAVLYATFTLVVLGSHGFQTPEIATLALGVPLIIVSIITLSTAYLALSLALMDTFTFDLALSRRKSWLLTSLVPLALVLLLSGFNKASFTLIISLGGIFSGVLTALLILLMLPRARSSGDLKSRGLQQAPMPSWLSWLLALLFIGGAGAELALLFA